MTACSKAGCRQCSGRSCRCDSSCDAPWCAELRQAALHLPSPQQPFSMCHFSVAAETVPTILVQIDSPPCKRHIAWTHSELPSCGMVALLVGSGCKYLSGPKRSVKPSATNKKELHFGACVSEVRGLLGNRIKGWR